MTLHRWFAIAVVASELAACTGADRPVPAGPSFDVTTDPVVTGSVVGPAGSICNSLSPNAVLIMRLISVARDAVAGSQNLVCPTNSYTFASVAPGSYLLRVQLPINDVVTAGFPWRVYSTTQVEVAEAPVARDLPVEPGLPLGGGVFLDGVGVPGISLILFHADVPIFGVAQGASGPDGRWDEFFERTPIVLQSGVRMPDGGLGWGVQFPVNPGQPPERDPIRSQIFMGGLIVGMRPDKILSANELNGYTTCGNCRAFGPQGRVHFNSSPTFGKKVTWQYSDAASPVGVGLQVVQKSYDGVPPADYVLFRFTLTNSGAAPITIYPGFFADWDIGNGFVDDVGATEGRLMYQTNIVEGGYAGSLIISDAPVAGASFGTLNPGPVRTTAELLSELAGDVTNPSAPEPGDHNYVQSIGPITLARGAATQFWIAIVAGESLDQLRSNAAAAAADVAQRRGQPDAADAADAVSSADRVWSGGTSNARSANSPACKKGCATVTQ